MTGERAVTVVLVNWNGADALRRGLASLVAAAAAVSDGAELVVVDNASADDSLDVVHRLAPDALVIENPTNVGFSPAVNQAVRSTRSRYVALVNNDVVCDASWLVELVGALEARPDVGSGAAQLRYLHDPAVVNSAGVEIDLFGRAHDRHDGHATADEPSGPEEVFGASGGAVLYRRQALEDVGLLDERFFAYLEDVDVAWRLRRAGWTSVYVPSAVVLHEHSATTNRVRGLKAYLSARNGLWTLLKNASRVQLAVALPVHCVLAAWTAILAMRRRDMAAVRGLARGAAGARDIVRERRGAYLPLAAFRRPTVGTHRRADRLRPSSA